jgi:pimeloyl-ACP methyl ester carboxylesterase
MKRPFLSLLLYVTILALVMTACSSPTTQPPRVEEISFESGPFHVVGDLRLPGGRRGPFPVVLFVHGSGPATRAEYLYLPIMERMLHAGYATFAWDKPGTGESTGSFNQAYLKRQRAQIILDAIEVIKARPDIDPGRIGLWGISQAGYVIPRVLAQSQDIAFVICVSCAGESGTDQMAFQVTALALCDGVSEQETDQMTRLLSDLEEAQAYGTYGEYLQYREALKALAEIGSAPVANWPAVSEASWLKNDPNVEDLWNPIQVIEQTSVPILAIYGERDRQIDPLQGAHAYQVALAKSGNPQSRVELFPEANHGIVKDETGCPADGQRLMEEYAQSLGYASPSDALEAVMKDPYKPGLLSELPFAPGFLDTMEEWLRDLRR